MAWLALDRALRIAAHHRTSAGRTRRWTRRAGGAARATSNERGFDEAQRHLHPQLRLVRHSTPPCWSCRSWSSTRPSSRRVRGTIDAVTRELDAGAPLLYRYPPGGDGLPGIEGAFLPCSFWLVQALARSGRAPKRTRCSRPAGTGRAHWAVRRGDGPRHPCTPGQLPAGPDARRPGPGGHRPTHSEHPAGVTTTRSGRGCEGPDDHGGGVAMLMWPFRRMAEPVAGRVALEGLHRVAASWLPASVQPSRHKPPTPSANVTIASRVQVTWSSQSMRIWACKVRLGFCASDGLGRDRMSTSDVPIGLIVGRVLSYRFALLRR